MKKILPFVGITLMILGVFAFVPSNEAHAASYKNGSCTVTVHSDYGVYGPNASTVDAWATSSGCGTLYYKMEILDQWGHSATSQAFSGYFSYRTPTKYFDIGRIRDYTAGGRDSDAYLVEVTLYSDSGHNNYIGMANKQIIVQK
ncbi:hypothetical protein SAMN05192559_107200 [Halobacillus karajensis]|uniref:hypothetical protein n=1 Tax=Halobacillus karajensis TaxID=195088 RepID=UPI0008A7ECBC|nr:hypothetical protein [Halobacillus karajensis]SEI02398.1 hypothetical protein SAMN05192559_107200 [Halobacillus karajensis]